MCMQKPHHGHGNGYPGHGHEECSCPRSPGEVAGGRYEKLFQPVLLLLLCEKSAHGYELHERLTGFGFDFTVDPTTVYRYLRRFEEQGFVTSRWETQDAGPARRLYEITAEGKGFFQAWVSILRKRRDLYNFILARADDIFDVRS
ncbi:MAG: helix-turn-helix transcriptional regulator [Bacillota bacterium]|nr:helix-turn-helix transcriptional regulator [Bacillota bacterium]